MITGFDLDVLTSLAESTEDAEKCIYEPTPHDEVATWHMVMRQACLCSPAKIPICDGCKDLVTGFMVICGPDNWDCAICGCTSDVIDIRPITS